MKLTIEIELEPDEIPLATELFNILKQISILKPKNSPYLFKTILQRLEDPSQLESVVSDLSQLFDAGADFEQFFNSLVQILFHQNNGTRSNISTYFTLLIRLPEPQKSLTRDSLLQLVLKHLAKQRPIDCSRNEFFNYAEGFAALVKLDLVSISGAASTIHTLLQKPETRCAAITMLGKTVETCSEQLKEKCDAMELEKLREFVCTQITEEIFRYDVNYIQEHMNWKNPSKNISKPTIKSPSLELPLLSKPHLLSIGHNSPSTLVAHNSFSGIHSNTIFALGYDEVRDQLISSGKDGLVISWTKDGKLREKLSVPKHYACSLDINPKHKSLFLCGVSKDGFPKDLNINTSNPAIIGYTLNDKGNWLLRGTLERTTSKLVSCVKTLVHDSTDIFVTGESPKSQMERERVRVYDASSNSFEKLQPIVQYEEHDDIITSLAHFPNSEGLFFSGSRDCTVKLWDKRQSKSVGTLGYFQSGGRILAHDEMVTCLESYDSILVSAGLDKVVVIWDIRAMDSTSLSRPLRKLSVDECAILKVAIGPSAGTAAVSTLKGLYLVDFSTGISKLATPFIDGRQMRRYHDLKWNNTRNLLYAGGDDMRVDQFIVV